MKIFRVGSENGGREAGDALGFAQKALNNVFFFDPSLGPYFENIDFFVLAIRVSGETKDFKGEGPEFLKKPKGKRFYTIDLTIPENKWKGVSFGDLRQYVVNAVEECFELCLKKSRCDGNLVDEERLRSDFDAGIQEILLAGEDDPIFTRSRGSVILQTMTIESETLGLHLSKQELMQRMQRGIFTLASEPVKLK